MGWGGRGEDNNCSVTPVCLAGGMEGRGWTIIVVVTVCLGGGMGGRGGSIIVQW